MNTYIVFNTKGNIAFDTGLPYDDTRWTAVYKWIKENIPFAFNPNQYDKLKDDWDYVSKERFDQWKTPYTLLQ